MFQKLFLVGLLSCALISCVDVKSQKEDSSGPPQGSAPQVRSLEAKSQLGMTEDPNSYQVQLVLPIGTRVIQRTGGDNKNPQRIQVLPSDATFLDQDVKPGFDYQYLFAKDDMEEISHLEVKVPIDLVVDQDLTLSQRTDWTQYRRLFFRNRKVITTLGFDLNIVTTEIISEGAKIQTFPSGQRGATDTAGRSGGRISLVAQKARGQLSVELRGENGGNGYSAVSSMTPGQFASIPVYAGRNGSAGGSSGSLVLRFDEASLLDFNFLRSAGLGGEAGLDSGTPKLPGPVGVSDGVCLHGPQFINGCQ